MTNIASTLRGFFWRTFGRRGEKHTCRRRMGDFGPWERGDNLDTWETLSWHPILTLLDKLYNLLSWKKWDGKWRQTSFGGTTWKWSWRPRTCSFDGGVHPEDAIRLISEGWTVEGTTKSYKRYLEPPGYREWMEKLSRAHPGGFPERPAGVWSPVPPVKVYVQHFTDEQIARFNEAAKKAAA